jgi:transposase
VQRQFLGVVEVDESFCGAKRVKGNRGRGAGGKVPVFGIFERGGMVYTKSTRLLKVNPAKHYQGQSGY